MKVLFRVLALVGMLALWITAAAAQVDMGQVNTLYQDLKSSDWGTRHKAFKSIQGNLEFLTYSETGDRLLELLVLEKQVMMRRAASGLDAEDELYDAALETAWNLWKDKLTPAAFRVLAEASYNPGSRYARELGARAGRFVKELLPLATGDGEPVRMYTRENATALLGYALAADQQGAAPLTPVDRAALIQALITAAGDNAPGVRSAAVRGMRLAGGEWAVPVLEKMSEREASFDPSGRNSYIVQQFRSEIKAAIEVIRARAGRQPPEAK
jgi:hypothetical protein